MRILIVEDDGQKLRDIREEVQLLLKDAVISTATSYKGGVIAALESAFDLLIVDMTLPTVDVKAGDRGYKMLAYGGAEIVRELTDENRLPVCILISSFDELGVGAGRRSFSSIAEDLRKDIGTKLLGSVRYGSTGPIFWKQQLGEIIRKHFSK